MRKRTRLSVIMMVFIISLTIICLPFSVSAEETENKKFETNMEWTAVHETGGNKFAVTEDGLRVSDTWEIVYAVSNQKLSDAQSFTIDIEYDMISITGTQNAIDQEWVSQFLLYGLDEASTYVNGKTPGGVCQFKITPVAPDGGYFTVGGTKEFMEESLKAGDHVAINVKYLATTGEIVYTINGGEFVLTDEFIADEGYFGLASAWCGWNVTKAVFTAYPDGLPEEASKPTASPEQSPSVSPTQSEASEAASPTTPPTESKTSVPDADDSKPSSSLPLIIGICAAAAIIIAVIIIIVKKSGKEKK